MKYCSGLVTKCIRVTLQYEPTTSEPNRAEPVAKHKADMDPRETEERVGYDAADQQKTGDHPQASGCVLTHNGSCRLGDAHT